MRLDALIIFHIEWRDQVSSLVGKQSKYWSKKGRTEKHVFFKNGWKPSQKMRLDALIIFHIEWRHQVSCLVRKRSEYWSQKGKTGNHVFFKEWLETISKDAPWCADHFPYWMTTLRRVTATGTLLLCHYDGHYDGQSVGGLTSYLQVGDMAQLGLTMWTRPPASR